MDLVREGIELGKTIAADAIGCSITELRADGFHTPVATGDDAMSLDLAQYRDDRGPCVDAARTFRSYRVDVIRHADQYPEFARVAAEHGVLSSLSLPLLGGTMPSALNLYASSDSAFDEPRPRAVANLLARCIAQLRRAETAGNAPGAGLADPAASEELSPDRLAAAWREHSLVLEARQLLVQRDGLSPEAAYRQLTVASSQQNRTMADLASRLLGGVA